MCDSHMHSYTKLKEGLNVPAVMVHLDLAILNGFLHHSFGALGEAVALGFRHLLGHTKSQNAAPQLTCRMWFFLGPELGRACK